MGVRPKQNMMTWSTVKNFGRVKYFNVSYGVLIAVPILAELHHKASSSSELFANTVAFPVTLRWLYAASLSFAVAIALYQYFCPSTIKSYESLEHYIEKNHEIFLRAHSHRRVGIVLTHLDPTLDSDLQDTILRLSEKSDNSIGLEHAKAQEELEEMLKALHPDAIQRFLAKDWASKNVRFGLPLWISFALYILGTVIIVALLSWRTLHVFYPS